MLAENRGQRSEVRGQSLSHSVRCAVSAPRFQNGRGGTPSLTSDLRPLFPQERTDDHDAETDTGAGRGDEHSEEDGRLPRGALRLPFGAAHAALLPDAARLPLL